MVRVTSALVAAAFLTLAAYFTLESYAAADDRRSIDQRVFAQPPAEISVLSDTERVQRITFEQSALQADSLNSGPVKNLAVLARASGNKGQADELLLIAANRSLRDLSAQADVLPILLARK